jgi:hypothetical protein
LKMERSWLVGREERVAREIQIDESVCLIPGLDRSNSRCVTGMTTPKKGPTGNRLRDPRCWKGPSAMAGGSVTRRTFGVGEVESM